jgi:pyochelin biosynthesis protein PchC
VFDWIRRYAEVSDAPVRLLCLPHAGGSAPFYIPLARSLAPAVEVLAVQYPGRQERRSEPLLDTVGHLAEGITAAVAPFLDRPLGIFGHSLGAVVGYEVALRLEAAGSVPVWLFASARRAPSRHRDDTVHTFDDPALARHIRRLGGTHAELLDDPDFLATVLPALRADYRAVETYRADPGQRLRCPVTAMFGDADPTMTVDEADDWVRHTTGPFELRRFTGDHFYLTGASGVVELLRTRLAGVPRPATVGGQQ